MKQLFPGNALPKIGDRESLCIVGFVSAVLITFASSRALADDQAAAAKRIVSRGGAIFKEKDDVVSAFFDMRKESFNDSDFEALMSFPKLRVLGPFVPDLKKAYVIPRGKTNPNISSKGIACLEKLPELQHLELTAIRLDAASLRSIGRVSSLKLLDVAGCTLPEGGLAPISKLDNLRELSLWGTDVGDAEVPAIGGLKNLETLYLTGTDIADKGLKALTRLPKLKCLILDDTHVTGAGLERLNRFPSLKYVSVIDAEVTSAGKVAAESENPGIDFDVRTRRNP